METIKENLYNVIKKYAALILPFIVILLLFSLWNRADVDTHSLSSLNGDKLLIPAPEKSFNWINFWSVSCAPCLRELPELQKLHLKYQQSSDIQISTVSMSYDAPNEIIDIQKQFNLTLPIGMDLSGEVARDFNRNMLIPSHYLIDKNGKILYSHQGELTSETIEHHIKQHI